MSKTAVRAFVLMPFDSEFDEVYRLLISEELSNAGYEVIRADDLLNQQSILKDVVRGISDADLIVADLTGANPNVYYELGLAHAMGKDVVLLTQDMDDIPFDLRPYRVVNYDTHFARIEKAREEFRSIVKGARTGSTQFGNPVTDFGPEAAIPLKRPPTDEVSGDGSEPEEDTRELPGLLDFADSANRGFEELGSLTEGVAEENTRMTSEATSFTKELEEAQRIQGTGSVAHLRKVVRRFGKKLGAYAEYMSTSNDRYSATLSETRTNAEGMLGYTEIGSADDRTAAEAFLDQTNELEDSIGQLRSVTVDLRETFRQLPPIERTFNRGTRAAIVEMDRYVVNLDQTLAMAARLKSLMNEKLTDDEPPE